MKKLWNMLCDKIYDIFFAKSVAKACDEFEHEDRCRLQYRFIPELVFGITAGKVSVDDFLDIDSWKATLSKDSREGFLFRWEELGVEKHIVDDGCTVILLSFPKPISAPEALYCAVLVDDRIKIATYYTLEFSAAGEYVLGSITPDMHFYFGKLKNPEKELFLNWVITQRLVNA